MIGTMWKDLRLPPGDPDQVWELFHENSKLGRYSTVPSEQEIVARMHEFHESLPYEGYPIVELPRSLTPLPLALEQALSSRVSARDLSPCPLTLANVATLLHYAYGVTRDNQGTPLPRPFRVVPSGGALYPLELFFYSAYIEGLQTGLYHYNPAHHHLRLLHAGDDTRRLAAAVVQPHVVLQAALIVFITAFFERSIFKYGERGYRFILLEAGHVAQNLNLAACGLGLGCLNIGGFFDRQIDDVLGLDGLTHSTLYLVALGKRTGPSPDSDGAAAPHSL